MDSWTYDEISETWLYGEENRGCGVFHENGWNGNACYGKHLILGCGPFPTKEEAMAECLKKLEELCG